MRCCNITSRDHLFVFFDNVAGVTIVEEWLSLCLVNHAFYISSDQPRSMTAKPQVDGENKNCVTEGHAFFVHRNKIPEDYFSW